MSEQLGDYPPPLYVETLVILGQEHLGAGHTSRASLLTTPDGPLVALEPRADSIAPPDYPRHHATLLALSDSDYLYAPRPHPASTQDRLVMTYADGGTIDWVSTAPTPVQQAAALALTRGLIAMRDISYERFADHHRTHKGTDPYLGPMLPAFTSIYIQGRFEQAGAGAPDPAVTTWLAPRVSMAIDASAAMPHTNTAILNHGDLSAPNLLLTEDLRLTIIDWEDALFMSAPEGLDDYGLGHLLNHIDFLPQFREQLVALAAEHQGIEPHEMERIVSWRQQLGKVADVVWAHMMHAQTADPVQRQEYLDIAIQRIHEYELLFTNKDLRDHPRQRAV